MPEKKTQVPTVTHAVFGEVTFDPTELVCWEKKLTFKGRAVSAELWIQKAADATPALLDWSAQFITRLSEFDASARALLQRNYDEQEDDSDVGLYLAHHLEELSSEEVERVFGKPKKSVDIGDLLRVVTLTRVGIRPAHDGSSATFDYTLGAAETNYVLAVSFDNKGKAVSVEMES